MAVRSVVELLVVERLVDEWGRFGVVGDAGSDSDEGGLEAQDIGSECRERGARAAVALGPSRGQERAGREREHLFKTREQLIAGRTDAPVLDLREVAARAARALRDLVEREAVSPPRVMDERAEFIRARLVGPFRLEQRRLPRTWGARRRKVRDDGGVEHGRWSRADAARDRRVRGRSRAWCLRLGSVGKLEIVRGVADAIVLAGPR